MNASILYLEDAVDQFEKYKQMAERSMAQVSDEDLFRVAFDDGNSIAVIAKHMAGNMLSRWTNFLTEDGEKANRNRDDEFEMDPDWNRGQLMAYWETGWASVFNALQSINHNQLTDHVTIRGESLPVVKAISRQLTHYAYHVGQIVLLARTYTGTNWQSLSIPRGQSEQFNAAYWGSRKASRPEIKP